MQIISVNLGKEQSIQGAKKSGLTGIYKNPVADPVLISALGIAGDAICDTRNHGGVDQAIYIYGAPDYAWWSQELGRELGPGTFGDNLTIAGLESASFRIGDRLLTAEVTLEVSAPRIPCSTLAARMGDPAFVKRFRAAERPGLYCRVVRTGAVHAGDALRLQPYTGETISILDMFRAYYEPELDEATLRRHLAAPIAIRDRASKEQQLQKLLELKSARP